MKVILVPTDFSPYATSATHVAARVASKTGASIVLLHNVNTLLKWNAMSKEERQEHPETYGRTVEAEERMKKLLDHSMFDDLNVNSVITHGVIYEEIVNKAVKMKADLIIMGSHGSESSSKYFIGSNLQKVLREAHCPVLSIKKNIQGKKWKKVVFAASFDEDLSKPFEHVRKIAEALGATIHLTYINTPSRFKDTRVVHAAMDKFVARFPGLKFQKVIYNQHELDIGILEYAGDIDADWIAMATHDRRTSPKYLIGITESVVYHAEVPVLSVNISG